MRNFKCFLAIIGGPVLFTFLIGKACSPPPVAFASGIIPPAYSTIQNGGTPLTQRQTLNMTFSAGAGSCADSGGLTLCNFTGTTSGTVSTAVTLTLDQPVFGAGASAIKVGTKTGNTNEVLTGTGSYTSGNLVKIDASGNIIDAAISQVNQSVRTIGATFDGGGSALTGTLTRCVNLYESGTIQQVVLIADVTGSVTVDVRTVAQTSYTGPASASSITAADTPALSSAVRFSDTTLTGWTTSLATNTVACFVMSSPATITWANITVKFAAN